MLRLKKPLLLAGGLSLALCLTALADSDDHRAREAGPEDGILCCNGLIPFLFHRDAVLTTTGRAGIFRSERRGERWQRSMKGLVASNGVSPFVGFLCQAPSQPRIVYALVGIGNGAITPFNGLFSSDDLGETWTRRGEVNTGFGFNTCAVDAADPLTLYVSGFDDTDFANKTWKSTDGGRSGAGIHRQPSSVRCGRDGASAARDSLRQRRVRGGLDRRRGQLPRVAGPPGP